MFEQEQRLYRFMSNYYHSIVKDLDEAALKHRESENVNPPGWILGHLALVNDFALNLLGQEPVCPANWGVLFGPGSDPAKALEQLPSREELIDYFDRGHSRVLEHVSNADPEAMQQPQPFEPLNGSGIETVADLVAHIMTTHLASHVGQLSYHRRLSGNKPLI